MLECDDGDATDDGLGLYWGAQYYDVEDVRTLSLKTDITIFWKTFTKLVDNFIRQF